MLNGPPDARSLEVGGCPGAPRAGILRCQGWLGSKTSGIILLCGSLCAVALVVPASIHAFRRNWALKPGSEQAIARAKVLLTEADAVFFDVDSTVVQTEGIDILGGCFGVAKEIAALTNKAMDGNMKFQDALAERLQLMADHGMTKSGLDKCVARHGRPQWSPGIKDVVRLLQNQGSAVYLVSGGFLAMLKPIAKDLNIPEDNVYGNEILFGSDGKYKGFNSDAPTCSSGGKPKVLSMMRKRHGYSTMIMFGDGATDLEARTAGPASAFIGYGGVQTRNKVKEGSDWFVTNFADVIEVLRNA